MTDIKLLHGFNVLSNKMDEIALELPDWKIKALAAKLIECWEIVEAIDRRTQHRRGH